MSIRSLIAVGLVMEACYALFYLIPAGPPSILLLIAVSIVAYLLLSFVLWKTRGARPEGPGSTKALIPVVIGLGFLFRLTLVPLDVVGSDDIYRYLWDGKVSAAGVNPYRYLPADPQLAHLATAELPAKVNHPELHSIYPPVAQLLFLISHVLFGESMAGMKLLLVLADGLTMVLLWKLLRLRGAEEGLLLVYAWSPLPVLYFGLDGHIDALAILFLVLSILLLLSHRPIRGAVAIGLGALSKLVPVLLVPLLFRQWRGMRRFVFMVIPLVTVAFGYWFYIEPTGGVLGSLVTFGSQWEFNGSIFSVIYFASGSNEAAHIVCGALLVALIVAISLADRPLTEKVFWSLVGFYILSPVVHPWYLTWLGVLLVIRWSTAIYVLLGLSSLANIVVYQYRTSGAWVDNPLILLCEYVPVFLLLARELKQKRVFVKSESTIGRIAF